MSKSSLSDPGHIKEVLARHGFHFSKALGQNFLINPGVCPRMAAECGAQACKGVIEVGPGIGVLTWELSQVAQKVCAIELDSRLFPVLEETLAGRDNVKLVPGDVMKLDLNQLIRQEFGGGPVCVCANLPYYITSPVILRLLEEGLPLTSITVMVQKEAAQRLCAAPGERECGAVSVAVHYRSQPKLLFQVGRGSFLPPPKVDSAVLRLDLRQEPPVSVADEDWFFRVSRAAFAQRRKTAANSLSATLGLPKPQVEQALAAAGAPENVRAERLTLEQLAALANALLGEGACKKGTMGVQ
ncbi:16S rRNA (adenine(1518)-N(6)/adenine(1519)-N(6))-dimethyltransferase RsmA [Acutalibacter sp. LFL-21]|uniref:16S rRNA (adenine(1518)-N(6)/adenine(1519)-N(6))- dimethyltransferase RsmA n=1 Tax=Acutalibacter sp. LFL-21 TaxID=2983399 RepID=UPI0021D65A47|nr:16S rRNA (adenine(1518)-N(6)/adenine(1519)-N(6))-dimethyltransferase RsmA [Acutalibacter sp. LFL-21]MCU7652920.1 16S rRNA (adenine(1518)-N(6)/adenine(1519)-N(6))-dimethyltransferase RsmA [Acutalibacter sp. LFL-21]